MAGRKVSTGSLHYMRRRIWEGRGCKFVDIWITDSIEAKVSTKLGKVSRKKVAVLFGQLVPLFLNAKNVDLSDIQNNSLSKILLK